MIVATGPVAVGVAAIVVAVGVGAVGVGVVATRSVVYQLPFGNKAVITFHRGHKIETN